MSDKKNLLGLSATDLCKSWGQKQVLHNVSFTLQHKEVLGLLGPNGAGKTTCFSLLTGLIDSDKGKILLDGKDITASPTHKRAEAGLSYLPQNASIFRGLSAQDNIMAILELQDLTATQCEEKLEKLLKEFSLTAVRETLGRNLSGGERRRVEIARCLASEPSYVLLDEPFAGIDPIAIEDLRKLVQTLVKHNIGVMITDHNVRETLSICDRAIIIHNGELLLVGTPKEILANKTARDLYLGESFRL